ncbi:MAG: hypothetical protein GX606_00350 [Elusimicrobia bacterium]|nr:hypothetical protein [Elusimicrobiota bacterium]
MIARLRGKVVEHKDLAVTLDVGGIFYEVFVPVSVARRIPEVCDAQGSVTLITHHYLQIGPSAGTPILVGFLSDVEKDFFLQFISVSGIGPKAAVKALDRSIAEIASAIDRGDVAFLKGLPGIGQQKAKDIVAKLQGKVGRFGLIQDKGTTQDVRPVSPLQEEAVAVLMQLQYRKVEAEDMVRKVFERSPGLSSVEQVLNEIYKQRVA